MMIKTPRSNALTLSVDRDRARAAKIAAIQRGTSLSRIFRDVVDALVGGATSVQLPKADSDERIRA